MSKPSKADPLIGEIGRELMPGHFFRRDEVSDLVTNLDGMHRKLEVLVKAGEATRAVRIYETMLSGVYAKIEEADDECDLAMLFHRLACGWIRARQAAGLPGEETIGQLLNWMKNDNYGFCHEIEKEVIKALDRKGRQLFIGHFQQLVEKALPAPADGAAKAIFDYENDVRLPAMSLKDIYQSLCDAPAYANLCGLLGFSPRDCERLAAGGTELILGLQNDLLLFQFHRRQVAARAFLGALTLVGSLLGQGRFEHLLAQGRRALALLLHLAQQLTELLFLFLVELVGLGAEKLSFQIGNDRLGFGQFLLSLRQLTLELSGILQQPGRVIGQLPQNFIGRLHPWSTSRKPRRNG
jgi:hypothetical protein